ncbi:MAG: TrkH family potassium uptake protein [Nanoarchaeota archaeon]|nr:TrkH family potassium uptake protein [Nanoarchaeota archaeon]
MENAFEAIKKLPRRGMNPIQIVVIFFISAILIGSLLLYLPISQQPGNSIRYVDALFTAASAVDVTGLVVVDISSQFSFFGKTVILILIQLGGLGYMTLATFFLVLLGRKITLRHRMMFSETVNRPSLAHIIGFARYVFLNIVAIEVIGAAILSCLWLTEFGAWRSIKMGIFHSISAFNNAGLDLMGNFRSLTPYVNDFGVNFTISMLIILGGIGFIVLGELYDRIRHRQRLSLHSKIAVIMSIMLILFGALFFGVIESSNPATLAPLSLKGKILASVFQSVSARTAGFNTVDIGLVSKAALFLLMILMFIGASPGGTGGGIKTTTFSILTASIASAVRDKDEVEMLNRRVSRGIVTKAIAIFFLSLAAVFVVTMVVSMVDPHDPVNILFEVVSAFGTVGLSTGITPSLTDAAKCIIAFMMFAGRVGTLTLILFFATKKSTGRVSLPDEDVQVG